MSTSHVPKLGFFGRRKKQIKRWWSKFFVEEAYIPDVIRMTCERYGEQVISAMLAGNAAPASEDLQIVFENKTNREYARAWLSETNSYNSRRDHWISLRDFLLEITVIVLILWEIRSGYRQDVHQSDNFRKQQSVLNNLVKGSDKTVQTLDSMNQNTEVMRDAIQKELVEAQRSAKAAERSSRASEASSKTATDALHISERAYLSCVINVDAPPKVGEKLRFTALITNVGKTVATDVVSVITRIAVESNASESDAR